MVLVIQNDYQKEVYKTGKEGLKYNQYDNHETKVMIEQNEKTFTVKIPILTKQTTVMEATKL
jgi:hypothetical protein